MKLHTVFCIIFATVGGCDNGNNPSDAQQKMSPEATRRAQKIEELKSQNLDFEYLGMRNSTFNGISFASTSRLNGTGLAWQSEYEYIDYVVRAFYGRSRTDYDAYAEKLAESLLVERASLDPYNYKYITPSRRAERYYRRAMRDKIIRYRNSDIFEKQEVKPELIEEIKSDLLKSINRIQNKDQIVLVSGKLLLKYSIPNETFSFRALYFSDSAVAEAARLASVRRPGYSNNEGVVEGQEFAWGLRNRANIAFFDMSNIQLKKSPAEAKSFIEEYGNDTLADDVFSFSFVAAYRLGNIEPATSYPLSSAKKGGIFVLRQICFTLSNYGFGFSDSPSPQPIHVMADGAPNAKPCELYADLRVVRQ